MSIFPVNLTTSLLLVLVSDSDNLRCKKKQEINYMSAEYILRTINIKPNTSAN